MRVGIIGLGFRLGYLAQIFSVMVPGFSIAGYVDPAPAGLPRCREKDISVGTQYATLEALLDNEKLDVLMVGSPNHLHLEHIRIGLERGVKIFAEKPVVTTIEDTIEIAKLIAKYGSDSIMVGLVLRYAPLYKDLRKAQADGLIGDVASIEASETIPPYHGAFFLRDWRRYSKFSGSFMLEKCCHDIDLYNGVMGARVARVASFGGRRSFTPANKPADLPEHDKVYHRKPSGWLGADAVFDSDGDIIDFQTAILQYQNGASMTFITNLNVPDDYRRFCVVGAKGMAEGDFVRNYFKVTAARDSAKLIDKTYQHTGLSDHYGADEQMALDLQAHIKDGAPLPVSVVDALEAGLVALAMDEAMHTRAVVDMAPIWARFDAALSGKGSA